MDSTNRATGPLVAAGIVVVLVGADIAALARWTIELYLHSSQDPLWALLSLVMMPRLLAGLAAGLIAGMLTKTLWQVAIFVCYALFLLWSFNRYEAFVEWSILYAAASAVMPYASGLAGLLGGFLIGRRIRPPR